MTAYSSIATALEAIRIGAINYIQKPATLAEILHAFTRGAADPNETLSPPIEVPSLARAEWEHISRVLVECNGSIRKSLRIAWYASKNTAAQTQKISRTTLRVRSQV